MHQIYFGKEKIEVASQYNELSRRQLLRMMPVMHSSGSMEEKVAAYTLILLDIPRKIKRAYFWLFRISQDAKIDVAQTTEFLFQQPTLTENKLSHIKINRVFGKSIHLYGPLDRLNKIVFMEFIKAETYYLKYHKALKSGDASEANSALNLLVAVLYRPRKKVISLVDFNGDYRQIYNDDLIEQWSEYTSKISLAAKQIILLFYLSSRTIMISPFKHLYPKMPKTDEQTTESKGSNWLSAIYALADGALNMDKVAMVDARLALYDLDRKIEQQKKQEKQAEENKPK